MNVSHALELAAFVAFACACSADGPPRPTGEAPFPMPNPRSSGLPNPQSYATDEANDLVLDQVTGLEWQRSVGENAGETEGSVLEDALSHCGALVQGGHSDFRLPTRLELVSLIDPSAADPALDGDAFPEAPSGAFWTSTAFPADPGLSAYVADFTDGSTSSRSKASESSARCVRNEAQPELPPANERFRVDGGTVLDRMTGLRWEREARFGPDTQDRARTYCADLVLNANANFRTPSMKELQTIVDDTRTGVLLDPGAFPNAQGGAYWSSTRAAGEPDGEEPDGGPAPVLAWSVHFGDGRSQAQDLELELRVRCVR